MRVRRFIAVRAAYARAAVLDLIEASAWFEVTPLPDDQYEIKVKDEEHPVMVLRKLALLQEG